MEYSQILTMITKSVRNNFSTITTEMKTEMIRSATAIYIKQKELAQGSRGD